MQFTCLSRRICRFIPVLRNSGALLFTTMLLAIGALAQLPDAPGSQLPASDFREMPEHTGAPTSLRALVEEAEQKNPQIAASFYAWQASRNVSKQASALPETQLSVQQFSVGSPRPFAGY